MTARAGKVDPPATDASRGDLLELSAVALILAVVAARCFLPEVPFRLLNPLIECKPDDAFRSPDEPAGVVASLMLLAAGVLWAAGMVRRREPIRAKVFAALAGACLCWSLAGCWQALDLRGALNLWLSQAGWLVGAWVMIHVGGKPEYRGLIFVVLAGVGAVVACKAGLQVWVETPERIADFRAHSAEQLARVHLTPGSPGAVMFERRMGDSSATGYQFLSNLFASLTVLLATASAGLAIDRLRWALRARAATTVSKGQVHLPTLAAILTTVLAPLSVVALVLTRSKGAIVAGVFAAILAVVVLCFHRRLAARRRMWLWAAAGVTVVLLAAVATLGVRRGGLPGASMQVRWEYWVGAERIVERHPVMGVGLGGFSEAYLRYRLPAAAESTKLAHNSYIDAAVQLGLPGAALYLALIVWLVVHVAKPSCEPADPAAWGVAPLHGRATLLMPAAVVGAVLLARGAWLEPQWANLLLEALLPGLALAAALAAYCWTGRGFAGDGLVGPAARVWLACGLIGFLLHNLVESTLWTPATGTVFWVAAGAVAGRSLPTATPVQGGRPRGWWPTITLAVLALGLVVAAVAYWPVYEVNRQTQQAQDAYSRRDLQKTVAALERAHQADSADAFPAARLAVLHLNRDAGITPDQSLDRAYAWARRAFERSATTENLNLYARAALYKADPTQNLYAWSAHAQPVQALSDIDDAIARRGVIPPLLSDRASVLHELGREQDAYDDMRRAAEIAKDRVPKLYESLARQALRQGRIAGAAEAFRHYQRLAAPLINAGEVLPLWRELIDANPMEMRLRLAFADVLFAAGRLGEMARQFDEIRVIDAALPPLSDVRLNAAERAQIDLLKRQMSLVRGASSSPASSAPAAD